MALSEESAILAGVEMLRSPFMSGQASGDQDMPPRRFRAFPAIGSDVDAPCTLPSSEPPRMLLVERDESMRDMLLKMLATHFRVEAVADGLSACHAAKLDPPALTLIDLYTPGTDDLTLIRAIRADARTETIPIILLATSIYRELLLRCLTAGASNFLLKPFTSAELLMCARVELQLRALLGTPEPS